MWQTDNPGTTLTQGKMSGTSVPLAGTYKEPDDTGAAQTSGADYFLSAGGATASQTAPSYGHVVCRFAFGTGANPDPWGGVGPITEQGTAGNTLNHTRGQSASP
ncbi:MAG: hypothetical protein ACYDAB_09975 [bacterium]